jgi:hypothetical protein
MKATLDRIEDGMAVLLVRNDETVRIDIPMCLMPEDCREGDIVDIEITRDRESTEEARDRVASLIEKLKKKNKPPES